ncbi:MAG TPA: cytochrome C [Burkholderiales bacterium]|nr:cytochrome C [Burkholderiales bacterium]
MNTRNAMLAALLAAAALPALAEDAATLERGRYVLKIGGCNDCHTPGYGVGGGNVPESQWLLGDSLGWQGPWGTTYPPNLRLYMQGLTEEQWLAKAKQLSTRPPMPWFAVRAMTEQDLRAVYRYIRHLGPAGTPAPAYVPPREAAKTPVVLFPQ